MAAFTAIVTKSQMDGLLSVAYLYTIVGISCNDARCGFPANQLMAADCSLDFFNNLICDTQATPDKLEPKRNNVDYLKIVELEPDADHLAMVTRQIGFYPPYSLLEEV